MGEMVNFILLRRSIHRIARHAMNKGYVAKSYNFTKIIAEQASRGVALSPLEFEQACQ